MMIGLARERLPLRVPVTASFWPSIAAALVSRMASCLESIQLLETDRRQIDAGILVRSLYEHLVHLAWLACDPDLHVRMWIKNDYRARMAAYNEALKFGIDLLDDPVEMERQGAAIDAPALPKLIELARQADLGWAQVSGMSERPGEITFSGMYALVYRHYSGHAHPSARGMNPIVDDSQPGMHVVSVESAADLDGDSAAFATSMLTTALVITGRCLGWPNHNRLGRAIATSDKWSTVIRRNVEGAG